MNHLAQQFKELILLDFIPNRKRLSVEHEQGTKILFILKIPDSLKNETNIVV
jgi:hypothetical protein